MSSRQIHHFNEAECERTFAWARYVYWAEVECQQYDAHQQAPDEPIAGLSFVLMVQWYAALYVAVEGWRECPLSDDTVDELLTDSAFEANVNLLRRFRNGVYHYQPGVINERLLGFLQEAQQTVAWAFLVHSEFKRIVWELANPISFPPEMRAELLDGLKDIVGWIPGDIPEAVQQRAAGHLHEAMEMILKHGSQDTPHAKELMQAVESYRSAAHQAADGWARQKRRMIDALKAREPLFPDSTENAAP